MKAEFMISWKGKQYVLYAGLLEEAHKRGLRSVDTQTLQLPTEENHHTAILKAKVELEDGRTFTGIGDASPANVGRAVTSHIIRMAETRAKARALRDAVNVGATVLEELSDTEDILRSAQESHAGAKESKRTEGPRRGVDSRTEQATKSSAPSSETSPTENPQRVSKVAKAIKSQVDLLRTLAEELRGEGGVERLEGRIGKPLDELTREEADQWIERLTPAEGNE